MSHYDVIIIGGGAAGLMAAWCAGKRGKSVLLLEHTHKIGEKIRISGGGRCNFTNIHATKANYISSNPHFMVSALAGYTPQDFISLVKQYGIAYHEKTLGQQFCDGSSKQIIDMLLDMCDQYGVDIKTGQSVVDISKADCFSVETHHQTFSSQSVVIACGGLSIPQIGASDFGYRIAKKFGLNIVPTRPALVPLTVHEGQRSYFTQLSGVSNSSIASYAKSKFRENILFTHRGLSGPAILQISSYLEDFDNREISVNLLPDMDLKVQFMIDKNSKKTVANYLKGLLTNRLVDALATDPVYDKTLTDLKKDTLFQIADRIHSFKVPIDGSEGYQKAEVTAGGVDTSELSSKTMESKRVQGLYFIGEVVDVTGWLGGYNFQWAWASGYAAGNHC